MGQRDLPLVSIVVPVHNGERYLRESLDSILAQDYPRKLTEVLVMDDASSDLTASIIASYQDRLKHHRQPRRRGQFENVNDGVALARGELIAVYHADDVYRPQIVSREVGYLSEHPDVGAVFCKDIYIDQEGRTFGSNTLPAELRGGSPLSYEDVLNALLRHKNVFLRAPSAMVRASVYEEAGRLRSDLGIAGDLEMWLRIARRHRVGVIDEPLFSYRSGHGSSSDRYSLLRTEPETFFEIMDAELRRSGADLAKPDALMAYEAHRAEDELKRAIALYILERPKQAQKLLREVSTRTLLRSDRVQRYRLTLLLWTMRGLVVGPRLSPAAAALGWRIFAHAR